ncbi:MAG TPA: hypothetical protein VNP37_10735, partial [Actinomycetospora sp.]|nr:hypothetical protein [Actinomycetospora sp.]
MTVPTSDRPRRARRAAPADAATPSSPAPSGSPAWLPVLARVALLPPAVCYAVAVVLAGVIAALASG